jgi:sugar lactone lactonase YvrE
MTSNKKRDGGLLGRAARYTKPLLFAGVAAAAGVALAAGSPGTATPELRRDAWSDSMIWNAVVADLSGIYVSGPRWAGNSEIQLAKVKDGIAMPFPDQHWNSWKEGEDASGKFVNINALHPDGSSGVWVIDTGSPTFGGDPLPGGAKMVHIALATGKILEVVHLPPGVAKAGSYVDDVRFHGDNAYLTDAGNPGLIIYNMRSRTARRVLDGHFSTVARADRPIVTDGATLRGPDGLPLKVHSDPMELSPDGQWLYYGALSGPWFKIRTSLLDDETLAPAAVAAGVQPFADLPPMGGSTIDAAGNLYFSDLGGDAIRRRGPDGTIKTIIEDPRLHWVDAMYIDGSRRLWLPAAQIDRIALFQNGKTRVQRPVALYSIRLD